MPSISGIAKELMEEPTERNWKRLRANLKKNGVIYYRVFFGKGKLSKTQDLRNSRVGLYNKSKKMVAEIPIFMNDGKKISGATIYLKGLMVLNG